MNSAVYSEWDSQVFKCSVAKMYLGEKEQVSEFQIAEEGRRFDVVFVSTRRWMDFLFSPPGLDHLYDMELISLLPAVLATGKTMLMGATDRHREIARKSFTDSRFLFDQQLKPYAQDLYARWVTGGQVHVVTEEPDDAFLITKRDVDGSSRISLVAVDEKFRGAGVGGQLIQDVIEKSPGTWRVKVSARNHRAIRFYEKLGFRVKDTWTAFHVWTKRFRRSQ